MNFFFLNYVMFKFRFIYNNFFNKTKRELFEIRPSPKKMSIIMYHHSSHECTFRYYFGDNFLIYCNNRLINLPLKLFEINHYGNELP